MTSPPSILTPISGASSSLMEVVSNANTLYAQWWSLFTQPNFDNGGNPKLGRDIAASSNLNTKINESIISPNSSSAAVSEYKKSNLIMIDATNLQSIDDYAVDNMTGTFPEINKRALGAISQSVTHVNDQIGVIVGASSSYKPRPALYSHLTGDEQAMSVKLTSRAEKQILDDIDASVVSTRNAVNSASADYMYNSLWLEGVTGSKAQKLLKEQFVPQYSVLSPYGNIDNVDLSKLSVTKFDDI